MDIMLRFREVKLNSSQPVKEAVSAADTYSACSHLLLAIFNAHSSVYAMYMKQRS